MHAGLCAYSGRVPSITLVPKWLRSAKYKSPKYAHWEHLVIKGPLNEVASRLLAKRSDRGNSNDDRNQHIKEAFMLQCPECNVTQDMLGRNLCKNKRVCSVRFQSCHKACTAAK